MRRFARAAVFYLMLVIASVLILLVAPAGAVPGPTPEFPIRLICGGPRWASYADYTQGLLSVDYQIGNGGGCEAYNVTLTTAGADHGVTRSTDVPIWMGDMSPGDWYTKTIKWVVPTTVVTFRTTLEICSTCDGTICVDGENGGIDIKPGSCPNSINVNKGDIAVAVFSYGDFDAASIDPATVIFAGASPARWAAEDKKGDGAPLDMVYHFNRPDTNLGSTDARACLSGDITGDGEFRSCDMVRMVG